jgi:hypothetical protein
MREWSKLGHPIPVYFTVNELETRQMFSRLSFIKWNALGKFYTAQTFWRIAISDENLRHQTEYELRSKLILLRRHYIPVSTSVSGLTNLMAESLSSFARFFAPFLCFAAFEPPIGKHKIVAATAQHLQLDGAAV